MTCLRLIAPAKINLYLHVLGRDARGYHQIDSLTAFSEAGDCLTVWPDSALTLQVTGPFAAACGPAAANLVMRAATGLARAAGVNRPGARIALIKNLPPASGIGGGSSDAAAAIRLLSRLWQLAPDPARDAELALGLGADVPVCLHGVPARVGGLGGQLGSAPSMPPAYVLLANPGIELPTGRVFERLAGRFGAAAAAMPQQIPDVAALARLLAGCRNDLLTPASELVPEILTLLDMLGAQSGCLLARMSGSGASCFGLFAQESQQQAAARALTGAAGVAWLMGSRLGTGSAAIEMAG